MITTTAIHPKSDSANSFKPVVRVEISGSSDYVGFQLDQPERLIEICITDLEQILKLHKALMVE